MKFLLSVYTLKPGSVKEPDVYLGADVKKFDKSAWGISSDSYCCTAVKEVERKLAEVGKKLANKVSTPMASGYRPELDATVELNPDQASYYQSLIGVLRWAVELHSNVIGDLPLKALIDIEYSCDSARGPRPSHVFVY
jgi:hypothetical protein